MRFFYDTEFIENGQTIDLVSVGIVAEDGREYHGVSTEFNPDVAGPWVRANVLPHLPPLNSPLWKSRRTLRDEIGEFLRPTGRDETELWAWVGAYDHVAICQLWGNMTELPRHIPRFTRELKQRWLDVGAPKLPVQVNSKHEALDDARHNLVRWQHIQPLWLESGVGGTARTGAR